MPKTAWSVVAVLFLATVCMDAQGPHQATDRDTAATRAFPLASFDMAGPIARAAAKAAGEIDRSGETGLMDAQPPTGDAAWARMRRLVSVGSAIRITLPDRASIRGTLHAIDEESLTIAVAGSDRTVARADILRVFAPSGTRRKRHVNIGLAIGAVAGGIVMMARRCSFRDTACNEESAAYGMSLMTVGAAFGGWVPPGTAWRQIYGRHVDTLRNLP